MKHFITLLLIILSVTTLFSQNEILIKNINGVVLNGSTITVGANITQSFNSSIASYYITNNTSNPLAIKAKKEIISKVSSTYNDFCWNGTCYPDQVMTSPGAYTLQANSTTDDDNMFVTHYHCQGQEGVTTIKYTLFVEGTQIESWFIINYSTTATTIPSIQLNNIIYPNPAKDYFTVDISQVSGENSSMEIFNMIGQKMYESRLDKSNKQTFDCSKWENGLYIVKIYSNNSLLRTVKFLKK